MAGHATEDAHKRSARESSAPMVAMDYGFLGRDTDADQATILVLAQRPHACQVLRKGPEPYAIDCVLAYLDSWGLAEVVLKSDNEPAIQALVDGVRIKRGEKTMVEKSPKYSHQSNGAAISERDHCRLCVTLQRDFSIAQQVNEFYHSLSIVQGSSTPFFNATLLVMF